MPNPFWNARERRLRALWRLLLHAVLVVLGVNLFSFLFALTLDLSVAGRLGALFGILGATGLAALALDHHRSAAYGLRLDRAWWLDLGAGLALGVGLMGAVFGVERALGWIVVTDTLVAPTAGTFWGGLATATLGFVCVGIYEEVLSRGYHLRNMAEGLNVGRVGAAGGLVAAWAISSALFGLGHAANPNASVISTANIIAAGLMLGLPVVLTGRLGLAIGLHITWNLAQGPLFGFPVSGTTGFGARAFAIEQRGPDVWTGGAFGPEAGLLGLLAMAAGIGLILAWVRLTEGRLRLQTAWAIYEPAAAVPPHTPETVTPARPADPQS